MKTYRLEVYGHLGGIFCHLYGLENLSLTKALVHIQTLTTETYQLVEESAE